MGDANYLMWGDKKWEPCFQIGGWVEFNTHYMLYAAKRITVSHVRVKLKHELQNWLTAYFIIKETNKKHCAFDTVIQNKIQCSNGPPLLRLTSQTRQK